MTNGERRGNAQPAALHHRRREEASDTCDRWREEMAALFQVADVMLVTPLRDGMNLVTQAC